MSEIPRRGQIGCGIPAHAMPLRSLAWAIAKLATVAGLGHRRTAAAHRILDAMTKHPRFVGGSAAFDTRAMEMANGKLVVKMGAEGIQVALPDISAWASPSKLMTAPGGQRKSPLPKFWLHCIFSTPRLSPGTAPCATGAARRWAAFPHAFGCDIKHETLGTRGRIR
jgi:hypothetical protein